MHRKNVTVSKYETQPCHNAPTSLLSQTFPLPSISQQGNPRNVDEWHAVRPWALLGADEPPHWALVRRVDDARRVDALNQRLIDAGRLLCNKPAASMRVCVAVSVCKWGCAKSACTCWEHHGFGLVSCRQHSQLGGGSTPPPASPGSV
eukprot:359937-Chlamydomonas_euryale.AAC.35